MVPSRLLHGTPLRVILLLCVLAWSLPAAGQFVVHREGSYRNFPTFEQARADLGTSPGEILLRPTIGRRTAPGPTPTITPTPVSEINDPAADFIDVVDTIDLYPGQALIGERKTAIRMMGRSPDGEFEVIDRPIVRFAFVDESDRDKPHGGSLRFLDLVRYRENLPLTNNAYAIDLNGADGVRLVYVTISKENKVAVGNFRGDSLHPLALASDYDPVHDFYYDFGAIAGASFDIFSDPFYVFTHAGILLDRVAPAGHPTEAEGRGQTFGWYGLIVAYGKGVGLHVNTGRTGYMQTTTPSNSPERFNPQELNLIQGIFPSDTHPGIGMIIEGDNWSLDRFIVEYTTLAGIEIRNARNVDISSCRCIRIHSYPCIRVPSWYG